MHPLSELLLFLCQIGRESRINFISCISQICINNSTSFCNNGLLCGGKSSAFWHSHLKGGVICWLWWRFIRHVNMPYTFLRLCCGRLNLCTSFVTFCKAKLNDDNDGAHEKGLALTQRYLVFINSLKCELKTIKPKKINVIQMNVTLSYFMWNMQYYHLCNIMVQEKINVMMITWVCFIFHANKLIVLENIQHITEKLNSKIIIEMKQWWIGDLFNFSIYFI